jgi:hypothetical protein
MAGHIGGFLRRTDPVRVVRTDATPVGDPDQRAHLTAFAAAPRFINPGTIAIVRGSAACPVKAVKAWLAYFEISRTAQRPPIVSLPRTHETIRRSNETILRFTKPFSGPAQSLRNVRLLAMAMHTKRVCSKRSSHLAFSLCRYSLVSHFAAPSLAFWC